MSNQNALQGYSEFVTEKMQEWKVPGIAVGIIKDGQVIFSQGFGYRDVASKAPVTPNTLFAIGSSSKAFTATSVGIMVDEGKLEWDKPVKTYLPTFKLHDPFASERMTPRDLLCHRSGLPRHDLVWYNSPRSRREIFDCLQYLEPSRDFRTNFQYQNLMYMTAGYLAGEVSGLGWEELVTQRIFKPLGMINSNFSVDESQQTPDFALPYMERKDEVILIPFRNITTVGPAGSINSNITDMLNWVALQLNKGKHGESQVISEGALKQIHAPQMVIDDPLWHELMGGGINVLNYGMGWIIQHYQGKTLIHHGGNIDGFSALVSFMPEANAGMVVLTNMNGTSLPMIVTFNAYDRLLGTDQIDWNSKFKAVTDKMKEQQEQAKKQSAADRKPDTRPSHALSDYLGDYEHPGYGVMSITQNGSGLQTTYNSISMPMEHYHYDTFEAVLENFELRLKVRFLTDLKGNIGSLAVQLEPMVKELVFSRMPDKTMQDRSFLEKFVGKYDLMGMTLSIQLKGDALIASIPGQPDQELVPYQGTTFNLKGLSGYSIEFKQDASGAVTEAVVAQPGGAFTAKKQ